MEPGSPSGPGGPGNPLGPGGWDREKAKSRSQAGYTQSLRLISQAGPASCLPTVSHLTLPRRCTANRGSPTARSPGLSSLHNTPKMSA